MRKMFTAILILLICFIMQISAFAVAPESVPADVAGNTDELIVVTKPQNQKDSTFNAAYIVSGYGRENTAVTLYWFDEEESVYKKIYNDGQYVDENGEVQKTYKEATVTIGASGLFMNSITLAPGGNDILVRAENEESVQIMRLSLTKYNYNLFDIIKSLTK